MTSSSKYDETNKLENSNGDLLDSSSSSSSSEVITNKNESTQLIDTQPQLNVESNEISIQQPLEHTTSAFDVTIVNQQNSQPSLPSSNLSTNNFYQENPLGGRIVYLQNGAPSTFYHNINGTPLNYIDLGVNPQLTATVQQPLAPLHSINSSLNQAYSHNLVNYTHTPVFAPASNQHHVETAYYGIGQYANMPMYINLNPEAIHVSSLNNSHINANIPYSNVPLHQQQQQQVSFNNVYGQSLAQPQHSHVYLPPHSYIYQQQQQQYIQDPNNNRTIDPSKNSTPQLTFNKANNRNYVPLYCGTCRTYGCQCFYANSGSNPNSNQEISSSVNINQHKLQQPVNGNAYSNNHQNSATLKATIEQQHQQYAAAAATAYYNYIQTSTQQQKQAFLEQRQKNQVEQNRIQVLNQSLKDLNINKLSASPTSSSSSSSSTSSSSSSVTNLPSNSSLSSSISGVGSTKNEINPNDNEIITNESSTASLNITEDVASKKNSNYSQAPILVHQKTHQYQKQPQISPQQINNSSDGYNSNKSTNFQQQLQDQQIEHISNKINSKEVSSVIYDTNNTNQELPHHIYSQYQPSNQHQQMFLKPIKSVHTNHFHRQDEFKNTVSFLPTSSNSFQHHPTHIDQYGTLMAYMKPSPLAFQPHQHLTYSSAYPVQFNSNHALKVLMHHHHQQQQYSNSKNHHNNQSFKKNSVNFKSKFAPYVSSEASVIIDSEISSSSIAKANGTEGAKSSANVSRDESSTVSSSSSPPLSSSSLNNSYLKQFDNLNTNFNRYDNKFTSGLDFNIFNKQMNLMSNYRAHYANVNSAQTLCRLGAGCKFKRENKCKYFHPNPSASSALQSKKINKSIEISDYSIENDNDLDVDCENVFESEKIKEESKSGVPIKEENEDVIIVEKS